MARQGAKSAEARLRARRKKERERKREERARRDPEAFALQKARENAACLDWDTKLAPHIQPIEHGTHAGCWLWRGGYHVSYGVSRPVVRAGQYGRQHGDVAVFLAHHGKQRLPKNTFVKRVCGNMRCVSPMPGHALHTNRTVENEKKRQARRQGGEHGHLQEGQGHGGVGPAPGDPGDSARLCRRAG